MELPKVGQVWIRGRHGRVVIGLTVDTLGNWKVSYRPRSGRPMFTFLPQWKQWASKATLVEDAK